MDELLKLEHLSVEYPLRNGYLSAVEDVCLQINRGEILALVGESGCGKSTVAYTIMGLMQNEGQRIRGQAIFKGRDLLALPEKQMELVRGKEIGMIFQNPLDSLNPVYRSGRQVYEAIALDHIDKRAAWARVLQLYQDVRIPDAQKHIRSYPHELSGGMRQRVMIAMMLSRAPELLIADEPTTALDVTIEAQILQILRDLKEKHDTAIVVITHNFGVVAEIADRIAVMYAGEIVEYGEVFQVFQKPAHPYTQALMRSLPRIAKSEGRLAMIEGTVPRVSSGFRGCRFANRCAFAREVCFAETPPLRELGENSGHYCRCRQEVSA